MKEENKSPYGLITFGMLELDGWKKVGDMYFKNGFKIYKWGNWIVQKVSTSSKEAHKTIGELRWDAYMEDLYALLNSEQGVQECDASKADSSITDDEIKIPLQIKKSITLKCEPMAQNNPSLKEEEDITECYVKCSMEESTEDTDFAVCVWDDNQEIWIAKAKVKKITLPAPAKK